MSQGVQTVPDQGVENVPLTVLKMLVNSARSLLLLLFMAALAYVTFDQGFVGASVLFVAVSLVLGAILYRKLQNEWVRAKFGEYRIDVL